MNGELRRSSRRDIAERRRSALAQRLGAAADAAGVTRSTAGDPSRSAAEDAWALAARACADDAALWLLMAAAAGEFPEEADVAAVDRGGAPRLADDVLAWSFARDRPGHLLHARVTAGTVIDVTTSATTTHNSGIQRVVRSAASRWDETDGVVLAAARGGSGPLALLSADDRGRLGLPPAASAEPPAAVIPWGGTLVLPEVPAAPRLPALAVLARRAGTRLAIVGHDAIPVFAREYVPAWETERFSLFLPLVQAASVVVAVSETAATEFRALAEGLPSVGSDRARVVARSLPEPASGAVGPSSDALVLVVGSKEPRKNQDAVVYAAERLWREGLDFELVLVGAYGWSTRRLSTWVRRARRAGRAIRAPRRIRDEELWALYERARFTVFPSFAEGFGLPVAESLARGVPVVTSARGSMAEVAAAGGCLTVDPEDDEEIVAAMRMLLIDDAELGRLRREATARPHDDWAAYADDVLREVAR